MIRTVSSIAILAMLSACSSGSGGGGLGQGGDNNNGNNDGWQQGVFLDWAGFYQQCSTTLDQNNFLRSYSNDTYLWYNEIVDRDPGQYNDPLQYFDLLVTNELSPSGQPKDKFHFTYDTEEWEQLSQSGVSAGYGIQWAFLSNTPPRDLRIAYTEPNSPATNLAEPLTRGVRILEMASTSTTTRRLASTL
jgi:carboxyl-terminal processing protease